MFSAAQTAVNGHLGQVVGSPLTASMVSFLVGLVALVVLCAILRGKQGPAPRVPGKYPWWTWTGGLLGAVYVLANIYLSGILGTGMTVVVLLVGATAGGAGHRPLRPFRGGPEGGEPPADPGDPHHAGRGRGH